MLLVEQNASLALAVAHRAYVLTNGRMTLFRRAAEGGCVGEAGVSGGLAVEEGT